MMLKKSKYLNCRKCKKMIDYITELKKEKPGIAHSVTNERLRNNDDQYFK